MKWPKVCVLRGANVWGRCPMLEVEVDLDGAAEVGRVAAATERLRRWLPDLGAIEGVSLSTLVETALALAFIASAETLLSAAAVEQMQTRAKTDYDRELAIVAVLLTQVGLVLDLGPMSP